jgi:6-aminohexanoate-oligomer exohydrolase
MNARRGVSLENWQEAPYNRWGFSHLSEMVPTAPISRSSADTIDFPSRLRPRMPDLESRLESSFTDAFVVQRGGETLHEQYFAGFRATDQHVLMSVSKSLCGLLIGRLVGQGLIDVGATVGSYVPRLASSGYGDATIQQVLDMTVAVDYSEDYADESSHVQAQDRVAGWRPRLPGDPVDTYDFLTTLREKGEHGRIFRYISADTDVLAWVVESVTGERYNSVLSSQLWSLLRPSQDALIAVDAGGFAFANGGIACTARDLARLGRLVADGGVLEGRSIVPAAWIARTAEGGSTEAAAGSLFQSIHPRGSYRNQWWVTGDAYGSVYAAGIHGQFIWVDPARDIVIVKFSSWPEAAGEHWSRSHAELFRDVSDAAAAV